MPSFEPIDVRRLLWLVVLTTGLAQGARGDEPVRFSRDVLPILAEHCFSCHGPDAGKRQGDLRLDTREGALAALSPGEPDESELLRRITTTDPQEQMPPPAAGRARLSRRESDILRRWIADGAPWGRHWAFELPVRSPVPAGAAHPIDAFIQARLAGSGLTPALEAPRHTLARRISLDLTGLPPTPEEVEAFVSDPSPDAWERLVDRLLASDRFGERMAMWWLDAARYSDTDGYQSDETRTNWPWRDWVISAFNANLPFDQFTLEQFAGDLLPNPTAEQRLATAFHRHHMTNGEGGRDPEESRIDYVIDRVNTVGTVWLGLTMGCCQCHAHKFDPISQHDYFALSAFFNSIDEDGAAGRRAKPYLPYESPFVAAASAEAQALFDERQASLQRMETTAEEPFARWLAEQRSQLSAERSSWHPVLSATLETTEGTVLTQETDGVIQASGPNPRQDDYRVVAPVPLPRVTGVKLEVLPHESHTGGSYSRGAGGHFILTDIKVQIRRRGDSQVRDVAVAGAVADHSDDASKHEGYGNIVHVLDDDPRNGWSTRDDQPTKPHAAVLALAAPVVLAEDEELVVELRQRSTVGDANIGRFRVLLTDEPGPAVATVGPTPLEQLARLASQAGGALPPELQKLLREQFLADFPPVVAARAAVAKAKRQLEEVQGARKVEVMVLADRSEPRETHVLVRGQWDKKGDPVRHHAPEAIAPWPVDAARTRLGLARWIVSPDNPLTSRVVVNHLWQLLFGAGLVRTPEDFGLQGERPSHPELLDWLAVDFMEHGWNVKRLIRQIVTSQTYRQQSQSTADALARDPENRLLARGARYRLPSWMLRDAALQSAGLLSPTIGGPPVRPYQPDGVWEENFMGRFRYEPHDGPAQYRRTLYAFWRRAVAPTFLFDSAQRRVCEVRLPRTNTPLQALTLLNDVSYLNAAYVLAVRATRETSDLEGRFDVIARRVLGRELHEGERQVVRRETAKSRAWYVGHPDDAEALLESVSRNIADGAQQYLLRPEDAEGRAELASLVVTASLILNLDEALTHE